MWTHKDKTSAHAAHRRCSEHIPPDRRRFLQHPVSILEKKKTNGPTFLTLYKSKPQAKSWMRCKNFRFLCSERPPLYSGRETGHTWIFAVMPPTNRVAEICVHLTRTKRRWKIPVKAGNLMTYFPKVAAIKAVILRHATPAFHSYGTID